MFKDLNLPDPPIPDQVAGSNQIFSSGVIGTFFHLLFDKVDFSLFPRLF